MAAAVEAFASASSARAASYHPRHARRLEESDRIRGSAQPYTDEFKACVALQAQYILDTFGKFPGTVPTLFIMNYLQAQHIDLDFYDRFFRPGAYLETHAEHHAALAREGRKPNSGKTRCGSPDGGEASPALERLWNSAVATDGN